MSVQTFTRAFRVNVPNQSTLVEVASQSNQPISLAVLGQVKHAPNIVARVCDDRTLIDYASHYRLMKIILYIFGLISHLLLLKFITERLNVFSLDTD